MKLRSCFLIVGCGFILPQPSFTQVSFSDQIIIQQPEAKCANSVFSTDLDGDGDMDVISASEGDDKIAWYKNTDGQGTFGPQQVITTEAAGAQSVYASDLDGDGDMDVLSASYWDHKIAWYENTGSGSFGPQQIITTSAGWAMSVYATDLDGDGDTDVLSAAGNRIDWYENTDSHGSFDHEQMITSAAKYAHSVYASDLDGDGDMDVLSASYEDNKIAWYENTDGHGTFGPQQMIAWEINTESVYAIDIDGDGDIDILSTSNYYDKIAWYENTDGQGTFGQQQVITTEADGAHSVYASDLDGDGDMDVLSASGVDDKIAWYENTGSGSFGPQQIITTSAGGARSVYATDLDGDGDTDVLSASFTDDKIAWYENTDGQGTFLQKQHITKTVRKPSHVYSSDLDGDGDMDILSASSEDDKIAWYENSNGQGMFEQQRVITIEADYAKCVYTSDLDDDGDMDVLSASSGDDKIAWYENTDGYGTFGPQKVISTSAAGTRSVYASDLDGDGDMDILADSYSNSMIAWYENTGGTFGPQRIITTSAHTVVSTYASDLDGDGDMDVLFASYLDHKIAWYENTNSQGIFGPQQEITTLAQYAEYVYVSDLDGDGDTDVLSASEGDDKIAWYENTDGQGTFGPQLVITTSADGARSVYATDLDGDGDADVLSASWFDDKIAWYENLGNWTFGSQQVITTSADGAVSVYSADLDGDGDMDVLSASYKDDKIAWYENLIPHVALPVFSPPPDTFITEQEASITCPTSGASIYYTMNGSDPTQSDSLYNGPISLSTTTILKARAYSTGMFPSGIASGEYYFSTGINFEDNEPTEYTLQQNYPNPFNSETIIQYSIPQRSQVTIKVYNLLGKEIKTLINEAKETGVYTTSWDGIDNFGSEVPSGVYIYKIIAGDFVINRKLILLR